MLSGVEVDVVGGVCQKLVWQMDLQYESFD